MFPCNNCAWPIMNCGVMRERNVSNIRTYYVCLYLICNCCNGSMNGFGNMCNIVFVQTAHTDTTSAQQINVKFIN